MAVTPVRTGPWPTTSLPEPEMSVVWPTSTPFTSVMALLGPGVPSKGTPRSRARGFGLRRSSNGEGQKQVSSACCISRKTMWHGTSQRTKSIKDESYARVAGSDAAMDCSRHDNAEERTSIGKRSRFLRQEE